MLITDIRLQNINYWADKIGREALAHLYGSNTSYINQLCKGHGSFGNNTARKLENVLGLEPGWFDQQHLESQSQIENEAPPQQATNHSSLVPLISKVAAGNGLEAADPYPVGTAERYLHPGDCKLGKLSFALTVVGESMTTKGPLSIPNGSIVFVDPEVTPENGHIVVAKVQNNKGEIEATVKKLLKEPGNYKLIPLNSSYDAIPIDENVQIVGVVKKVEQILDCL
ncbi:LexA family transcriptional regulator [Marinagarivorans algicola]|uniref:LexA family transcriptional regulator n=1 Tax=Marinagarivorans algicola TaxID=1513270 RepID=UPI0037350D7B